MAKYWIDTCVWRDFYEDRLSKTGNPLGKYAHDMFMKILLNKDIIFYSESLIWELKRDYDEIEISNLLNLLTLSKTLIKVEITKEEYIEAKKLSEKRQLPFVDCLNAIQARNNNAILISQDEHIISGLIDLTKAIKPQNI